MKKEYTVVYRKHGEVYAHLLTCDGDVADGIKYDGKTILKELGADSNSPLIAIIK